MVYREVIKKFISVASKKHFDKVISDIKVLSADKGKCEVELEVKDQHTNIFGTLHGGCSATLVDLISGYALLTHPNHVEKIETFPNSGVSVDMHLSYQRAAKVGSKVIIQADTVKSGRNLAFLEVKILDAATKKVVVTGTHTKYVG